MSTKQEKQSVLFYVSPVHFAKNGEIISGSDAQIHGIHGLGLFMQKAGDPLANARMFSAFDFDDREATELSFRKDVDLLKGDMSLTKVTEYLERYEKFRIDEKRVRAVTDELNLDDKIELFLNDVNEVASSYSQYECGLPDKETGDFQHIKEMMKQFLLDNRDMIENFYEAEDDNVRPK